MISINSSNQSPHDIPIRTSNNNLSSKFSDLLSEQITKSYQADKSKQPVESDNNLTSSNSTHTSNSRSELERLLAMNPIELIRYQMLEEMGLTEEALKELPFEERMKVEEKIQEKIDQVMMTKTDKSGIAEPV
jgi:hypothetical protein